MRIIIVEDEPPIAQEVEAYCREILGNQIGRIETRFTLKDALAYLSGQSVDLCLLDLNLNGKNGFDILKQAMSRAFHTIIVSAHTEQAVEAFKYGVLDFVPKPVEKDRFRLALNRYLGNEKRGAVETKYLIVRKRTRNYLVHVDNVLYLKSMGYLVELHLKNGRTEIIEKPLNRLEQILPERFFRIHRSYIVDLEQVEYYKHVKGGVYTIILMNGNSLPLSPRRLVTLKKILSPE